MVNLPGLIVGDLARSNFSDRGKGKSRYYDPDGDGEGGFEEEDEEDEEDSHMRLPDADSLSQLASFLENSTAPFVVQVGGECNSERMRWFTIGKAV